MAQAGRQEGGHRSSGGARHARLCSGGRRAHLSLLEGNRSRDRHSAAVCTEVRSATHRGEVEASKPGLRELAARSGCQHAVWRRRQQQQQPRGEASTHSREPRVQNGPFLKNFNSIKKRAFVPPSLRRAKHLMYYRDKPGWESPSFVGNSRHLTPLERRVICIFQAQRFTVSR